MKAPKAGGVAKRMFERLSPERQREILLIAAEEFGRNGFRGTSYNRLLARAGLGKGSAYYYFADKQDLFLTVVTTRYCAFFDGLTDLPRPRSAASYWDFVEAMSRRGMELMRDDPTSAALIRCFAREGPALDVPSSKELHERVERYYADLVTLGQELRAVRCDVPFALLVELARAHSTAFDQWFIATALPGGKPDISGLARTFAELSRGLLAPPYEGPAAAILPKAVSAH
ncbi:MAG TPA: TetR/AcrR family transcriptional regulator [Polyangiaceae bacterium]|nr:TetR/AcrR family transcriptional regulator [Polyangiaceae bacterium]